MLVRYHWIRGKEVRSSDGRRVGRVTDLVAVARGDELYVTALLVGPGGFARRMSLTRGRFFTEIRVMEIPWRLVADVGDDVRLSVGRDELRAVLAGDRDADTRSETEPQEQPV